LKWTRDFEVGISSIDDQHKRLCSMVTEFENAVSFGHGLEMIGIILKNLVDYVKYHFEDEERVMAELGYPDLEAHKLLHKGLVLDVKKILLNLKAGKEIDPDELITFLHNWLAEHILGEDVQIGKHAKGRQITI